MGVDSQQEQKVPSSPQESDYPKDTDSSQGGKQMGH
jgi:hypothetical protein